MVVAPGEQEGCTMTDGALPTSTDAGGPVSAVSAWKTHLAAAIGAFFLGLTDFIRHGTDSTTMLLNGLLTSPESEFSLTPAILLRSLSALRFFPSSLLRLRKGRRAKIGRSRSHRRASKPAGC